MMGGSEGKVVYLHHSSAESEYYTLRCVLRTKWSFHSVLGIKSVFVVCCTQIHTFTMSLIQISLLYMATFDMVIGLSFENFF